MLPPCELANVKFIASSELTQACQQFGDVYVPKVSPEKCYVTGKDLEVAEPGERATTVLHVIDQKGKACSTPVETLTGEFVSESTGEKIDCSVKKTEASGQYKLCYQATTVSRGRHQLHVKVEGEHIKGSPFPVSVKLPVQKLGTPIKTISGLKVPTGVVLNQKGEIIIAESSGHCVSIFDPATGEKIRSLGLKGSQFNAPRGVTVDGDGNILVVDNNHCIQMFSPDGNFIASVGKKGNSPLKFYQPVGVAVHPLNKKVYIADSSNHRVQILNPDLTFSSRFGSRGSGKAQFIYPWDVAFDSIGNVYVADTHNHCVQVFTAEGEFLQKFGVKGSGDGELSSPSSISIDSDNVVYVADCWNNRISLFTCEGRFLTSFGELGCGPGQFVLPHGIALDKNGVLYVTDTNNSRLQMF
jgi:tripartite motif-containing protein 2/3/tripartite motif-containing protein 71